jgi:ABC-type sugar transport system permease subunit
MTSGFYVAKSEFTGRRQLAWWRRPLGGLHRREVSLRLSILVPAVLYYLLLRYYPVLQTLALSLTDAELLKPDYAYVGTKNFTLLFGDAVFVRVLRNTLYYAFATTFATTIIALALSFVLNPIPRGSELLRLLFYLPMVSSAIAVATIWLWLYQARFGLINAVLRAVGLGPVPWLTSPRWALPSLIIMGIWGGVGYSAIIFVAGLRGIPAELREAARIDGAGPISELRYITLPLLSRVVTFVLVTGMIGNFQVFQQVYLMTRGGPLDSTRVLALHIYDYAFRRLHIGQAAAMAVVLFVLVATLTVVQLRLQRSEWEF